jgi:hypothetical protein
MSLTWGELARIVRAIIRICITILILAVIGILFTHYGYL